MVSRVGSFGSKASSFSKGLDKANDLVKNSTQRLSTGKRINKAADDAAGLFISELLGLKLGELEQSSRNIDQGYSLANVANSAMDGISDSLIRMQELAQQSANGTLNDGQREALNQEYGQLREEINRTVAATNYNDLNPFESDSIKIHADSSVTEMPKMNMDSLLAELNSNDIGTQAGAQSFLDSNFGEQISNLRSSLGAAESRLKYGQAAIDSKAIAYADANSRIRDADVADEVARLTRGQILQQFNTALQAQVNNLNVANAQRLLA